MLKETSRIVFDYLKGFVGQQVLTCESIAEATGLDKKVVQGAILGFQRKELIERKPDIDENGNVVKWIVPTEAINTYDPDAEPESKTKAPKGYSDNSKKIIRLLQSKAGSTEKFTSSDISKAVDIPKNAVEIIVSQLAKKSYLKREDPVGMIVDGEAKNIRYITVFDSIKEVVL